MYSLCSVSIWNKTMRPNELTPADALKIVKYGSTDLGKVLVTNYWGVFKRLQDAMEELKEIPASHYQSYLEGRGNDGSYRYIWEGVILYEDGRAICAFNEPWRGRRR